MTQGVQNFARSWLDGSFDAALWRRQIDCGEGPESKGTNSMSLRERVEKELKNAKEWAADAEFQARLAKAEAGSELRKVWMETEQRMAKLEARLEDLGGEADEAAQKLLDSIKDGWAKLKSQRNN
jgi:hypothetical protein